jgi:hypothetical protein
MRLKVMLSTLSSNGSFKSVAMQMVLSEKR